MITVVDLISVANVFSFIRFDFGRLMRPAPRDRGASGWEHPVSLIGHCPIFGEFGHLAQKSQLFGRHHGRHYRRHCHLVTA